MIVVEQTSRTKSGELRGLAELFKPEFRTHQSSAELKQG